jgi:hypothetical protein
MVPVSALQGLSKKWRQENGDYPESKQDCADELDALLATAQTPALICACGTTMVCPDIGCDLHKGPQPEAVAPSALPKRGNQELTEALRIRALALCGEKWERTATADMMKEAADAIEVLETRLNSIDEVDIVLDRAEHAEAEIAALRMQLREAQEALRRIDLGGIGQERMREIAHDVLYPKSALRAPERAPDPQGGQ